MTAGEADENACRIEHVLTDGMLEAIKAYLHKNNINIDR